MPAPLSITPGARYGMLRVVKEVDIEVRRRFLCACDCGGEAVVRLNNLTSGNTRSCGCLGDLSRRTTRRTHGLTETAEYRIWTNMRTRCYNLRNPSYPRWGGRGITICDRWRRDFAAFYADMGPRPSRRHSIDRVDNDGNYEPGNCRWATPLEQRHNQRPRQARRS